MNSLVHLLRAGLVLWFFGTAVVLAADDKNLASNGSFEEVAGGVPKGWFAVCSEGGTVTHRAVAEGAKEGKHCLHVTSKGEWAVAGSPKVALDRTKKYSLTGLARVKSGTASIKIDYYKGDEYLGHSESNETTKSEWTSLKADSELDSYQEATHVLVAGVIHGDGEAFFDGFVLTAK